MVEERDDVIVRNLPLVHSIANRFRGRGAEYEDLYQAGCIGLIKAVDNFDESRGFQFSTYAVPVIMGEIRRIFREGAAVKVSRALRDKSVRVQAVREQFIRQQQREPTVTELAEQSGLEQQEIAEVLQLLSPTVSLSIDSSEGEEEWDIPVDETDRLFDRLSVSEALTALNPTERRILHYRFFEDNTQMQTARRLGISQVQVSRKEKALLLKLRQRLE